ncbi:MAG: hypothetical protein AABW58_00965 [Nanoarchaeota archaeon]
MFTNKDIVLDFVKRQGPVLPIQVAKQTNSNTMFAGALLSELIAHKLIKISCAKIGGSPVYYVDGQEEKLSILYDHLPGKEKEAFVLLKNSKVLLDDKQEPSIRFALSQIKDFSIPFMVNIKNTNIKAWRWHLVPEQEAVQIVKDTFKETQEIPQKPEQRTLEEKKEPKKPVQNNKFFEQVQLYLNKNKVVVLQEEIIRKGKEVNLIVKVNSSLGELTYLVKATDKKSLSEKDIIYAFNHGNLKKMPVILLSKAKLSKKAEKYINENLKGFLTFRTLE